MDESMKLRVAILVGSTRPGRKAGAVARWVHGIAAGRGEATFEVVDLADDVLPHLDEPLPPLAGRYSQPHTRRWAATIGSFDAYVFVTPEYNHSAPGALKNAIDYLFGEWNDKAAGFVSYGFDGGVRAVEQLRLVMAELKVACVRSQPALSFASDFRRNGHGFRGDEDFTPGAEAERRLTAMLDELLAWGAALRSLREPARPVLPSAPARTGQVA